jgi:hypothetical protein
MNYESPITYHSKDMANVKVFADRQTDKQTGKKLYAPDLSIRGHKKIYFRTLNVILVLQNMFKIFQCCSDKQGTPTVP